MLLAILSPNALIHTANHTILMTPHFPRQNPMSSLLNIPLTCFICTHDHFS